MLRKMTMRLVPCILILVSMIPVTRGQQQPPDPDRLRPEVGFAVRYDVSDRLEEMAERLPPQAQRPPRQIPLRVPRDLPPRPQISVAPDVLRQAEARPVPDAEFTPQPERDFEGLSNDHNAATVGGRIVPPDTEGDVGPNYYVQWINLIFAIYDKDTGLIAPGGGPFPGNSLWSGFGGPCETNNDGDPIVLYDHLDDRWFLSQFSIDEGTQCVALTVGSDPRGPYHRWAFQVSPGENNDYPKFGLMPDAYYLSLRDFPSNDGTFASAVAFDRRAMLAGAASPAFVKFSLPCLAGNCPDGIQPPHLEGPAPGPDAPGIFTRIWDDDFEGPLTGSDGYRLWQLRPDFVNPGLSTFTELAFIAGSDFDSTMCGFFQRNCIPQPPPGERLDPIDELQMYRAQFRHFDGHDTIVVSTTADATGGSVAGVRWAELRNPGSGWVLHQEGTFAPADGLHRWMSSIAMDGAGNIALGYSVSGSTTFPSVRYTTREATDPLGVMPGGEVELVAGSDVQTSSFNRWGDYSTLSLDPGNDCTFWYTQEYQANDDARTDFDFKTRIGAFTVPACQGSCGDGVKDPGEDCDGTDFGDVTCTDFGCSGSLTCRPDCTMDSSSCVDCGNCDFDGTCELGEDCDSCPNDCVSGESSPAFCGDGVCQTSAGENCSNCASDCNGKLNGKPSERFCCGDGDGLAPAGCADARCTSSGFSCNEDSITPESFCCGDGLCEAGETCGNCSLDCLTGSEVCTGGVDEDCDGLIDCNDSDCNADPACDFSQCVSSGGVCDPAANQCCPGLECLQKGKSGFKCR